MNKQIAQDVQWIRNKCYSLDINQTELDIFKTNEVQKVLNFQQTHPLYSETPLHSLENLAKYLQVAEIKIKDESHRFGLNAFKVMGGIYAIGKYLVTRLGKRMEEMSFAELQATEVKEQLGELTFITATDGNHGRGIAWAARELGHKSVVYMPRGSSLQRLNAIRGEGAEAEIMDANYDETVRFCAQLAAENEWILVQDTAWEGYEEIPLAIMQGYAGIAQEIIGQLESKQEQAPTHIFLQAGVGSFAAGIAAYFRQYYQHNPPKIIVVEPSQADCYYRSFINGTGDMEIVRGDMQTIMAGLACGEPSTKAFRLLKQYAWASFSCADSIAALGMRVLGHPLGYDPKIISGESGAAVPLGLIFSLITSKEHQALQQIMLDEQARILLINTEGDTDAEHYLDVVWKGHYPTL